VTSSLSQSPVALVAKSMRCLIYALSDWRIRVPFAVESHPIFCEADTGVISLKIKTVGAWPLTSTLCLKFRGTEAVPSFPYTSFTTCRFINYSPTTFHFPFVQTDSVMVDTTHITNFSFYNTCTLHNLQFLRFLVNDQRYKQILFYVFIYIYNSLHVSSTSCSSSGETNCVNTTTVTVTLGGWE
jgi:hypothetical protein